MKLLEDLGMQYPTETSKRKARFGLYECPVCLTNTICCIGDVNRGIRACRSCVSKTRNLARVIEAAEQFAEVCSKIHEDRYDYSLVDYKNNHTNVDILCSQHGVFQQAPNDHKKGRGCPACAITGFNPDKSAILYYLKVEYTGAIVYKIGITNRTVQERFSNIDLAKIKILKTWDYPLGSSAYKEEQEILKLYRDFKYVGEPLLSSGNTELFTFDILDLDS